MSRNDLAGIVGELRAARSALITSHANPDGDAVGAMLVLYHALRAVGKEPIVCVNDDPVPRIYQWLPGADAIRLSSALTSPPAVDVCVIVDAARKTRIGKAVEWIAPNATLIVIDHHLEERPDGDLVFLDATYSAVGEMLVELFDAAGAPLQGEAALCAYVSIITDTGGFRYANTTPRTHRITASLLERGIDVAAVSSRVFDVMPIPKYEMLRRVLDRIKREANGRVAYATISAADMQAAGARSEDTDGIVNFPRNLEGVELGILFREIDPETTKVSMRSRNTFNCARFLEQYGGGGHAAAAGATLKLPLDEACRVVLAGVRAVLGEQP